MINFKATKANLTAHADSLEAHAKSSLTAWILTGNSDKYLRVMGDVLMLRNAASIKRIEDRREYLKNVDGSF